MQALAAFEAAKAARAHPDAIQAAWEAYTEACQRELEAKREKVG